MNERGQEFKTLVYEKMNGLLCEEKIVNEELSKVKDEFSEGELHDLSERLYRAKDRLYDKLGVDDDPDIEILLDCFEKITESLCLKMYDYGVMFS